MIAPLRIGTRGSPLALWQARYIAEQLRPLAAPREVVLVEIETTGDQIRDRPLGEIGGEGLFTKEIQRALLEGRVELAVHSLKDLPTVTVAGLVLGATPPRGPVGDALVSRAGQRFVDLPEGATVATSSLRRRTQMLHRRPDLRLVDIRGNVDTRLRKLHEQHLDALVLAEAGLVRLGLAHVITDILDPVWMFYAVGQGALGIECRADDAATQAILARLDDARTRQAITAERAVLRALGGGCQMPLGVRALWQDQHLVVHAAVLDPLGHHRIEARVTGAAEQAEQLGQELAQRLRNEGADALLAPQD
jgi:hydroxymethylbilane synthase